ncbi:hypothetical protein HYX12_00240 [Candidatus Woesearchaeota archaeon]|nr:hypothetical protein [Candidatus Woesearchaeota archaeon]
MIYIHQLNHLNPKAADNESTYIIRELKQRQKWPLDTLQVIEHLKVFLVTEEDQSIISQALESAEPTIQKVVGLFRQQDPLHEHINVQRAVEILHGVVPHLKNNLAYTQEIFQWQVQLLSEITPLLNSVPKLRTMEEKVRCNNCLKQIFEKILRNPEFYFNFEEIVGEGPKAQIASLCESMSKGFFFHVTLEEELKKLNFIAIKDRIPLEKLEEAESIEKDILQIKKGIDQAYDSNFRLMNLAIVLYSYVKWSKENLF